MTRFMTSVCPHSRLRPHRKQILRVSLVKPVITQFFHSYFSSKFILYYHENKMISDGINKE